MQRSDLDAMQAAHLRELMEKHWRSNRVANAYAKARYKRPVYLGELLIPVHTEQRINRARRLRRSKT